MRSLPVPGGRTLVVASAGSGKTFRLTSRLIGLLAAGVPPAEILASTFTRKAAGEIAGRVLLRLAAAVVDAEAAAELRASMPSRELREELDPALWPALLQRTVRGLHRLHIDTLDAFFHRVARTFAPELGLPPLWEIADSPEQDRLRTRAVEEALTGMEDGVLLELVRLATGGETERGVHSRLLKAMDGLRGVYREIDRGVPDPWGFEGGEAAFRPVEEAAVQSAVEALADVPLPRTKKGTEDSHWRRAMDRTLRALELRDWGGFLASDGFVKALLEDRDRFSRHPIPGEVREACVTLFTAARGERGRRLQRQIEALGSLVPEYDRRLRRMSREEGLYGFDELTWVLAEGGGLERREELHYRLDGSIRHLLLDEFQDTSLPQWLAIEPLVSELFSGDAGERAAFVVADPKQSIYGWRGGEPRLLEDISQRFGVVPESVAENWRSSQVVLDFVNRVFEGARRDPSLAGGGEVVERWLSSFERHVSHGVPREGYVRVEVGPGESDGRKRNFRPALLREAAATIAEVHGRAPGATVGVLTWTNKVATWLIAELQRRGIEASEEGGVPITDSEPVLALLALLRMADHPEDRISSYLVARTPAGYLVGLGAEEWGEVERVEGVARELRQRLLDEGYGPVLSEWVRALSSRVPSRDRVRLRHLTELAFQWDRRATLRPTDFVRYVESARAEDPAAAAVRVMTVHRAKGLEFDAVVLAGVDGVTLGRDRKGSYHPFRLHETGPVVRVYPHIPSGHRALFPEVEPAVAQARDRELRDALSTLYVAFTRARHALYILVPPKRPGSSSSFPTGADLLRGTLPAPPGECDSWESPGTRAFEEGNPEWFLPFRGPDRSGGSLMATSVERPLPVLIPAAAPPSRLLARRTPSELEGDGSIAVARLLRPDRGPAMRAGTLVHHWLEQIEWMDDGLPDRGELLEAARALAPHHPDPVGLLDRFLGWLNQPEIGRLLRREGFPEGSRAERELPFVIREGGRLLHGVVDRVVHIPGRAGSRWLVVDWKTDAIEPGEEDRLRDRITFYAPQLRAYLRAVSRMEGVPAQRVEGVLAFLPAGRVIPLPSSAGPSGDRPDPTPGGPPGLRSPGPYGPAGGTRA